MRILLIGDVHGRHRLLADRLATWHRVHALDVCIQVGDFGFSKRDWGRCQLQFPLPVHVICGNHEDHAWLRQARLRGWMAEWRLRNCHYQSRGSVLCWDGARIGFLGGALHIDRPQCGNRRRRTTNYILAEETEQALAAFGRSPLDLLITHSCPGGIGIGMRGNPALAAGLLQHVTWAGYDAGPPEDCGERELTRLWKRLSPRPPLWVFGHFHHHRELDIEGTRFLSLPCIETTCSLPIYDTRSGRLDWIPLPPQDEGRR